VRGVEKRRMGGIGVEKRRGVIEGERYGGREGERGESGGDRVGGIEKGKEGENERG
jgi:hypothetical protein